MGDGWIDGWVMDRHVQVDGGRKEGKMDGWMDRWVMDG